MKILSRQDAIESGNYLYFTGQPCKYGHIAQRYTKTCVCSTCHKNNAIAHRTKISAAIDNVKALRIRSHVGDHKALLDYAAMLNAARGLVITNEPIAPTVTRSGFIIPDTTTQEYRDSVNAAIAQTHARILGRAPTAPPHIPAEFQQYATTSTSTNK